MDVITSEELLLKDIRGKVICFPTDTVYGVGALLDDEIGIKKIYELKHRDISKPLAVLTGTTAIDNYVLDISDQANCLMEKYWPGALTLIFKKKKSVSNFVTSHLDTVGFRMPNSKTALKILNHFGPLATTSINISGSKPLNNIEEIKKYFSDEIDYLISDIETTSNISSTVIDVTTEPITVLRQGDIII